VVEPPLPPDARLRAEFRGREDFTFETGEWVFDGSRVRMTLPVEAVGGLSGPVSVGLHVLLEGVDLPSARAAVHVPDVLKKRSLPVSSEARAKVPPTLVSLRAAQHLDLLELLRNLLVTNTEQLREHRGISATSVRERRLEENLDEEPTYNPEDIIVEERVRAETVAGAAQYVDFEERSLYEHIMSAIRKVVYPAQQTRTDRLGGRSTENRVIHPRKPASSSWPGGAPTPPDRTSRMPTPARRWWSSSPAWRRISDSGCATPIIWPRSRRPTAKRSSSS
jgi:hypothetical protein